MGTYTEVAAKAQCCSEGGGRHWTISDTGGTLDAVTSGDLVIIGELVGVALCDYDTATDSVVIDTVGCHELPVSGLTNGGGGAAIAVGDWLYFDGTADAIYKWNHTTALDANDFLIGQAMVAHDASDVETICVKLQPAPTPRLT